MLNEAKSCDSFKNNLAIKKDGLTIISFRYTKSLVILSFGKTTHVEGIAPGMPLVSSDIQSHHVAAWLEKKAAYLWKVHRWCNFHVLLCQKRCCSPFTSDRSVRFLVLKVSSKIDMGMATWCDMGHPLPQPTTIARSKELVARLHQWHFHVLVLLQLPLWYLQHLPGHAKISAQVIIFHRSEKNTWSQR